MKHNKTNIQKSIFPKKGKRGPCSSNDKDRFCNELRRLVFSYFQRNESKLISPDKIFNITKHLNIPESATKKFIYQLIEEQYLKKSVGDKLKVNREHSVFGVIRQNGKGKMILSTDQSTEEIFINPTYVGNAVVGDTVRAIVIPQKFFYPRQAQVIQIVKRGLQTFHGVFHKSNGLSFVSCDNPAFSTDIFIREDKSNKAKEGNKVAFLIRSWAKKDRCPTGEITRVYTDSESYEWTTDALTSRFGMECKFSPEVLQEIKQLQISASDPTGRIDYSQISTFTIDPEDAKDFDDALSYRKLSDDEIEIGIHIADVSEFIKPGSALDQEAYKRGCSIYFCNRVIPMLPEDLCNNLCSLIPGEKRLCYSVIVRMNNHAGIISSRFESTIIQSKKRFTYEEVDNILTLQNSSPLQEELIQLHKISKHLREKRLENGSLIIEKETLGFTLDDQGKAISFGRRKISPSHLLIEEFMLLANKCVAEFGQKIFDENGLSFLFRTEGNPHENAINDLNKYASVFGIPIPECATLKDFNRLSPHISNRGKRFFIEKTVIRALQKASYNTENIGHYGLSFNSYTHFTSPIRRYPDIIVHRLLKQIQSGEKNLTINMLEKIAKQCSIQEELADAIEQTEIRMHKIEYLHSKIGCNFRCLIINLKPNWIEVEIIALQKFGYIKNRCLRKGKYRYDKEKNIFQNHKHQELRVGQEIKLTIQKVSLKTGVVSLSFT